METLTDKILVENYKGIDIYFQALTDYTPVREIFLEQTDIDEACKKIDSYEWVYFCAKVTAEFNGIEIASDYLGACIYEDYSDFYIKYKGDYFEDMRHTVYTDGLKRMNEIRTEINQFFNNK